MTADDESRSAGPVTVPSLSYHWRDRARVEELARALGDRGLRVFLDRWYLTPGLPWPQRLETALRDCRAVVVCVGAGEMGSIVIGSSRPSAGRLPLGPSSELRNDSSASPPGARREPPNRTAR